MKLAKAIEILGDSCWDYIPEYELDIRAAIKLGIEALKRIQSLHYYRYKATQKLLPGETED